MLTASRDNMARWALEARATITFWDGQVPEDAPGNQLQDVYEQQGIKPQLDWASLPKPFELDDQPAQPTARHHCSFSLWAEVCTIRVVQLSLWEAQCKAAGVLCEVANLDEGLPCPAD